MQEKDQKDYAFIKEKIKEKPINKRRVLLQVFFTLMMAVLFGLVASFVIAYFLPKMEHILYPEGESAEIGLPGKPMMDIGSIALEETEAEEAEPGESGAIEGEEDPQEPINMIQWQPTLEDYQSLLNQMYAIGREANKFIVTVTGVRSNTDWFNNAYQSKGQASGIIIANNGQELLILTEKRVLSSAEEIYVTFTNDVTVRAFVKKYDGNTGITVLNVPLSEIEDDTLEAVSIAVMGDSLAIQQGTLVIAIGSPLGTNDSIRTGNITTSSNTVSTIDANYSIFTTDIVWSSSGSGALINLKGEVIGLVMQDYSSIGDDNTLTAVAISDLEMLIAKLSSDRDIAYLGLGITTVTSNIEKEYDIPKGVYVKEVKMDSPAMAAGIQSGDVVVEIGGTSILTEDAYEKKLMELMPGDVVGVIIKRQGIDGYVSIRCDVEISSLK